MAEDDKIEQQTLTEDSTPESIDADIKGLTLFQKLKSLYLEDLKHTTKWRKKAHTDRDFYDGHQWSDEDRTILRNQKRPCITMNRIKVLVNAVVGSEINNRRQVQYYPREIGDAIASELLTGAGEWFRQQAQAEDEESIAFQDALITGMGWCDTRLDYETNVDGCPVVQRLDPFKMVWDCNSERQNLIDAQRLWYVDDKPLAVAKQMFPDVDQDKLCAGWAIENFDGDQLNDIHDQTRARYYLGGQDQFSDEMAVSSKLVRIVECRYLELKPYYQAVDPMTGEKVDLEKEELDKLLEIFPELQHRKVNKKVVKRVFLGGEILGDPDSPATPDGVFGWECITGYYDNKHRHYHGLVRGLVDVQRWTNKFFSQVMYLLNSQSKGGIFAERGVFDNDRQAEQSIARADAITYLKPGAINQNKIMPKPVAEFPAGFWNMFLESKDELTQISGLSPEFIGTREVNQPGILESQRRQSTLNLLASLFNSLRRYRQRQGYIVLYLIQNYLSDGRLVRIVGDGKAQYIPLTRDIAASAEYDIIVDDAPTSPNEKDKTFAVMQQLLPMLQEFMTPDVAIEFLRYSPLPATLVEKIAAKAEEARQQQAQQSEQPDPAQQAMMMQLEAKTQMAQTDVQAKQAKADIDLRAKMIDLQVKQNKAQLDAANDAIKAQLQADKLALEAEKTRIDALRASIRR